jgi:hypothetical protein
MEDVVLVVIIAGIGIIVLVVIIAALFITVRGRLSPAFRTFYN